MNVTIFGILWMILIVIFFINRDPKKIIFMSLFAMIFQANNVIVINNVGIGPQVITSIFTLIRILPISYKNRKLRQEHTYNFRWHFVVIFIIIIISSLINYDTFILRNFALILMFFSYLFLFITFTTIGCMISAEFVSKSLKIITVFVLCVGLVQYLVKASILPKLGLLETFIYSDNLNPNVIFYTKDVVRFYSTFMEPSYAGAFLAGVFYFFLNDKYLKKHRYFLLSSLFLALLLTQSTTAYVAFLIMFLVNLVFSKNIKNRHILIIFSLLFIVLSYIFLYPILDEVLFSKMDSSSARVRGNWNMLAWNNFINNPLLGVGYKESRASSIFFTIVGELGIIGIIVYLLFFINSAYFIVKFRKSNVSALLFVVTVMLCQFIAIPDIDFSVFWLSMYILALSGVLIKNKENNELFTFRRI